MQPKVAPLIAFLAMGACDGRQTPTTSVTASAVTPPASVATATSASVAPPISVETAVPAAPPPGLACRDLSSVKKSAPPEFPLALRKTTRAQGIHASTLAPWQSLRAEGFRFAYAAAAYGGSAMKDFAANWKMMKACGFPRGAYHFVVPKRDGLSQAQQFLELLQGDYGELPHALDLERPIGCKDECCERPCSHWQALAKAWIDEVKRVTQRNVAIYTTAPFYVQCMCATRKFADSPLWLAAWPNFDFPEKVKWGGWTKWTFYHYLGNKRFKGGVIDVDLFNGDEDAFATFLAGG